MAEVERTGAGWRWFCGPCLEHSAEVATPAEAASQADDHDGRSWHG